MRNSARNLNLLNWYKIAARVVDIYGENYLPIFERLIEEVKRSQKSNNFCHVASFVNSAIIITESRD